MDLQAVEDYVRVSSSKSDLDRTGGGKDKSKTGAFTGAMAIHPLSGEKVSRTHEGSEVTTALGSRWNPP